MARLLLGPGILGGFLFLFWLWALIDVIATDSILIRNMQKGTWLFLVVFVPTIGAAAWVFFGRPEGGSLAPGGAGSYNSNPYRSEPDYRPAPRASGRSSRGSAGAEDSPGWSRPGSSPSRPASIGDSESLAIRQRKLMEKEAELAKREAEIQAREKGATPDPEKDSTVKDSAEKDGTDQKDA